MLLPLAILVLVAVIGLLDLTALFLVLIPVPMMTIVLVPILLHCRIEM